MVAHSSTVAHVAVIALCSTALVTYGIAWLGSRHRSSIRLWSAAGGVTALAVATAPTMERWASSSFTGHMGQHLLMIVVAAPLLVLARPASTIVESWTPRRLHPTQRRRVSSWWRRTGPLLAPACFVATLYLTHLTPIYDAALSDRLVHDLEHAAYVVGAGALWSVVTASGRAGAPRRVGAVFGVIGASALLGAILLSATTPLVPTYARQLGADAALDDQRTAATLMWVGTMAITLPLLIVSVWRWAAAEERIAERSEAARAGQEWVEPLTRKYP